jgi:hypothetical protein
MPSKTLIASAANPAPPVDLDLEAAAGVADAVADVVDRVEDRVAVAVAGDAADQQRGVAGLRRPWLAEWRDRAVEALFVLLDRSVELVAIGRDPRLVLRRQPAPRR